MLSVVAYSLPAVARAATQTGMAASVLRIPMATARARGHRSSQVMCNRRMFSARPSAATEKVAGKDSASHQERTVGDKIVVAGLLLRGAAVLPRFASVAPILRVAGTGPMFLGMIVTAYEFGGWYLVLGAPAAGLAVNGMCKCADNVYEESLRKELMNSMREGCPDVPPEAVDLMSKADVRQFETNCVRLEYVWPEPTSSRTPHWKIEAQGTRQSAFHSWTITSLKVSRAVADKGVGLPPQRRSWDGESWPVRWDVAWERT